MKTIIAGGRDFEDFSLLKRVLEQEIPWKITSVVCGGATGADENGEIWALSQKIPVEYFNANWNKFGKSAGVRRNTEMAKNAEALIVFWDGKSKGTRNMLQTAHKYKLKTFLYKY